MFRFPVSWTRVTSLTVVLVPLSWVFSFLVALRRACYDAGILQKTHLAVPVIVVGNLTVGGTGKTPLVLWIAALLRKAGYKTGIVSRGYGSTSSQPRAIKPENNAASAGDEPLLLARRAGCPVWVGADRVAAALALLIAHPEFDVIISDDGLQHYALSREFEIAVVDGARGLGNGLLQPAGPLREPRDRLDEVDAILINGTGVTHIFSSTPCFRMQLEPQRFYNLRDPAQLVGPTYFSAQRVHAVAGIGNPQRFFATLSALGLAFTAHTFPDHHAYTERDLAFADCDAIVMTEKDAVKCEQFGSAKLWGLRVEADVEPELGGLILEKLGKKS